ncbi:MAG: hypothetical protein AB7D36_12015 [Oscillospiraceae bacterium]
MNNHDEEYLRLLSLYKEALRSSYSLLSFTQQKYDILAVSDEIALSAVLKDREELIGSLIDLENQIDRLTETLGLQNDSLTGEIKSLQASVRSVLDRVSEMDVKAINLLRKKLQTYKNLTMRARNKKNLSAYIKMDLVPQNETHFFVRN